MAQKCGVVTVSADWVLDCIEQDTLLPTDLYNLSALQYEEEEEDKDEEEAMDGGHFLTSISLTRQQISSELSLPAQEKDEDSYSDGTAPDKLPVDNDNGEEKSSLLEDKEKLEESQKERVTEDLATPTIPVPIALLTSDPKAICSETSVEVDKVLVSKDTQEAKKRERRESGPQLLSGLVFCVVDYPQLMDNATMEKWREVGTENRRT